MSALRAYKILEQLAPHTHATAQARKYDGLRATPAYSSSTPIWEREQIETANSNQTFGNSSQRFGKLQPTVNGKIDIHKNGIHFFEEKPGGQLHMKIGSLANMALIEKTVREMRQLTGTRPVNIEFPRGIDTKNVAHLVRAGDTLKIENARTTGRLPNYVALDATINGAGKMEHAVLLRPVHGKNIRGAGLYGANARNTVDNVSAAGDTAAHITGIPNTERVVQGTLMRIDKGASPFHTPATTPKAANDFPNLTIKPEEPKPSYSRYHWPTPQAA